MHDSILRRNMANEIRNRAWINKEQKMTRREDRKIYKKSGRIYSRKQGNWRTGDLDNRVTGERKNGEQGNWKTGELENWITG